MCTKFYQTAGVICFSIEPKTKSIYVLLGKETCFEGEKITDSKNGKWCDFGGRLKSIETNELGAAREFTEESLGVISFTNLQPCGDNSYKDFITDMLEKRQYCLKLKLKTESNRRIYFLKQIEWQPGVEQKFQRLRYNIINRINTNHPAFDEGNLNKDYLEKYCIKWWSIDRLTEVIRKRGMYKNEACRKSFRPVLSILVPKLRTLYSS